MEESVFSHEWLLFISLCETSSLKTTAERFNLSTSAASRSLKRLEDSLGVSLFDRCSKPMMLTPSGKILYRQVKPAMKITREALENLRSENYLHSDLRIGFLDSMAMGFAPKFLNVFKKEVGTITCLTGSSDRLIERLKMHDLDIIVSSDPALRHTEWKRLLLIREPSIAVFPNSMDFGSHSSHLTWSNLSLCNLPFINSYGKSGRGKLVNNFLITYGIQLIGKINADNLAIKLSLVADGNGWSITSPLSLYNHPGFKERVRVVPLPPPGLERRIYLIADESVAQDLFQNIAQRICSIYEADVLPSLKSITQGCSDEFFIQKFEGD